MLVGTYRSTKRIFWTDFLLFVENMRLIGAPAVAKKRPKMAIFYGFMTLYSCLIDFKVVYYVSTHQNLSFGTKFRSL